MDAQTESRIEDLIEAGDFDGLVATFRADPSLANERLEFSRNRTWLHFAAMYGTLEMVDFFHGQGLPLNAIDDSGSCPLAAAAQRADQAMVKWMLNREADPLLTRDVMTSAVYGGNLEIVKTLVERGVDFNFTFGEGPRTPLSLALMYDRNEVADYLRSLGAIMPPKAATAQTSRPAMSDAQRIEEIVKYFEHHLQFPAERMGLHEIIPGKVNISMHAVKTNVNTVIFTTGMSWAPMSVPAGKEKLRYAELVMYLPVDWPAAPSLDGDEAWPMRWLRAVAHYPHEHDTWLGGPLATFANGDPPQRLSDGCEFTGFLLAYNRDLPAFVSDDGRLINTISLMPLYTEELELAQQPSGFWTLFERFDKRGIMANLNSDRPNVAR